MSPQNMHSYKQSNSNSKAQWKMPSSSPSSLQISASLSLFFSVSLPLSDSSKAEVSRALFLDISAVSTRSDGPEVKTVFVIVVLSRFVLFNVVFNLGFAWKFPDVRSKTEDGSGLLFSVEVSWEKCEFCKSVNKKLSLKELLARSFFHGEERIYSDCNRSEDL